MYGYWIIEPTTGVFSVPQSEMLPTTTITRKLSIKLKSEKSTKVQQNMNDLDWWWWFSNIDVYA